MQRAIVLLFIVVVSVCTGTAGASSEVVTESASYQGHIFVDAATGSSSWANSATPVVVNDVYSNVTSIANLGISSPELDAQWGDQCLTTGTGLLSEHDFTIYNGGFSAGDLLTANVTVTFYDFATNTLIATYSVAVDFGAGLAPGRYSIVTVTNLDPQLINLGVTNVLVIQTITAKTGAADRLGVASLNPVTIGSSPDAMYLSTMGPPGMYDIGPIANPGYRIGVTMAPVPVETKTWGSIKALYR